MLSTISILMSSVLNKVYFSCCFPLLYPLHRETFNSHRITRQEFPLDMSREDEGECAHSRYLSYQAMTVPSLLSFLNACFYVLLFWLVCTCGIYCGICDYVVLNVSKSNPAPFANMSELMTSK